MKRILTVLTLLMSISVFATDGDTTWVNAHDVSHLNWYGRWDNMVSFPNASMSTERVLMFAEIGCPTGGCSGWDYTVKIELRHNTGVQDSTLNQQPTFTVDGNVQDTLNYSATQTSTTSFNSSTNETDTIPNQPTVVIMYTDANNPTTATDTLEVYAANYWNYQYDNAGAVIDSSFVSSTDQIIVAYNDYYVVFDVIENYELARVITPYGGYYNSSWNHTWKFDVSDFRPLLSDSTTISLFYGGWEDGFTMSVDFAFVEGTPAREVLAIDNIYSSGMGGFTYGEVGNSSVIENSLVPVSLPYLPTAKTGKIRATHSGHSFGGTENCAEFCPKKYYLKLNGTQQFEQLVWRDDCGMNPLYHQSGTWLYDRANWCPGDICITREHEIEGLAIPGTNLEIDMDMDTYNYDGNAGFTPNYIIESQLVQYGDKNFVNEASVEQIIAPTTESPYLRFNPLCGHPKVLIRNNGSAKLTSATITYGAKDAEKLTYNWTGDLDFLEVAEVELPSNSWMNWAAGDSTGIFEVTLSNPNEATDENPINNTLVSTYEKPVVWPNEFYMWMVTNNAGAETSYIIETEADDTTFYSGALTSNTTYKDTFNLVTGCYKLTIKDTQCDGLQFFANNDGGGSARIMAVDGGFTLIETYQADFGCEISTWFTIGYESGHVSAIADNSLIKTFMVYPNPTGGNLMIESTEMNANYNIYDVSGKLVKRVTTISSTTKVDLADVPNGIYFISNENGTSAPQKVVITR